MAAIAGPPFFRVPIVRGNWDSYECVKSSNSHSCNNNKSDFAICQQKLFDIFRHFVNVILNRAENAYFPFCFREYRSGCSFLLTKSKKGDSVLSVQVNSAFLLFRVVEIQRICEATATPETEGANLSE